MVSRNIKAKALQIKTETQARANSANRVGGLFEDIADELTEIEESAIQADNEDLTVENGVIKFKDKSSLDGMGHVILRKNKTFASQVNKTNTIYEVKYDFDLDGAEVTIPAGCTLKFDGGKLTNGVVIGNSTIVEATPYVVFSSTLELTGTFTGIARAEWFEGVSIQQALIAFNNVQLLSKEYMITESILMPVHSSIIGSGNGTIINLNVQNGEPAIKPSYWCTIASFSTFSESPSPVVEVSTASLYDGLYEGLYDPELATGNSKVLIKDITIRSSYAYTPNAIKAIALISDGKQKSSHTQASGFWGVKIENVSVFGAFEYAVMLNNGRHADSTVQPWITDCQIKNVTVTDAKNFLYIGRDDAEGVTNTQKVQRINVSNCSLQSRSSEVQFTDQRFAILKSCRRIQFNDCTPWDFDHPCYSIDNDCSSIKLNNSVYGIDPSSAIRVNVVDPTISIEPYDISSIDTLNEMSYGGYYPKTNVEGETATYEEAFEDLAPGAYYINPKAESFYTWLGINWKKAKSDTTNSFHPMLKKEVFLNNPGTGLKSVLITLFMGKGLNKSAYCYYSENSKQNAIEWFYNSQSYARGTENESPTLDASDAGYTFFTTTYGYTKVWSGTAWVDAEGYAALRKKGSTANRPILTSADAGYRYYDTTVGAEVVWNGTAWSSYLSQDSNREVQIVGYLNGKVYTCSPLSIPTSNFTAIGILIEGEIVLGLSKFYRTWASTAFTTPNENSYTEIMALANGETRTSELITAAGEIDTLMKTISEYSSIDGNNHGIPAGSWWVPSLKECQTISKHYIAIKQCFSALGLTNLDNYITSCQTYNNYVYYIGFTENKLATTAKTSNVTTMPVSRMSKFNYLSVR